jgi:hypothetical protein
MGKSMLLEGLGRLSGQDKLLLKLLFGLALGALALGILAGAGTALARAGFIDIAPLCGYRAMTVHGVAIFFYWLYFVQAAMLLAFSTVYTEPNGRIAARGFAWAGMALMFLGLLLNLYAALSGLPLLYDAPPGLAARGAPGSGAFYLGYLALAAGLCLVAVAAVATALKPRFEGRISEWSVLSFANVAWAGLLMVSAVAAFNAFLPAALWAYGLVPMPSEYSTAWHVLFHNMHYLPLMATVLVWYALVEASTAVKSVFGTGFSKVVFALYLILVPPTSLYHMFLEPDLAESVRAAGSLLSLFISVPTVLVFLVIVAFLEVHARAQGAQAVRQGPRAPLARSGHRRRRHGGDQSRARRCLVVRPDPGKARQPTVRYVLRAGLLPLPDGGDGHAHVPGGAVLRVPRSHRPGRLAARRAGEIALSRHPGAAVFRGGRRDGRLLGRAVADAGNLLRRRRARHAAHPHGPGGGWGHADDGSAGAVPVRAYA